MAGGGAGGDYDVVAAGHLCLDLTPTFRGPAGRTLAEIAPPGGLALVGECVVSTGGCAANTGLALARLGLKCLVMGKVGDDALGHIVMEKLAEHGSADGVLVSAGEQTSYSIVLAPPGVDRAFLHNPGANDSFGPEDVPWERLAGARLFHFGYPQLMRRMYVDQGRELARLFELAREQGVTTSLDMAHADPDSPAGRADWRRILERTLPHVDLFVPNVEEVFFCLDRTGFIERQRAAEAEGRSLTETMGPEEVGRMAGELLSLGAGIVMLKAGPRGIYLRTGSAERLARFGRAMPVPPETWAELELWQPALRADRVASATGAGDCAVAGFLGACLRGEPVELALKVAAAAGRQNVMVHDGAGGILPYEQTLAQARELPAAPPGISAPGWHFDRRAGLWRGPGE